MDKLRELRAKVRQWHDANGQGEMPTEEAKSFCAGARAAQSTILFEIDSMLCDEASLSAAAGPTRWTHLSAEPIAASAPSSPSVGIGPKQKCPRCGEPRACYSCGVMFEDDLGLNDAVAMTPPAPQKLRGLSMETANDVMQNWIQSAREHRLKIGTRELTPEECDLCVLLLQAVAGDLSMIQPPGPEGVE
jgi:hypothetical protein